MACETRSRHGCWTCRLRRKKCDERHPACWRCEQSNITCHGYGKRPEWMDGGNREKGEVNRMKSAVAKNAASKRSKSSGPEVEKVTTIQLLTPSVADSIIASPSHQDESAAAILSPAHLSSKGMVEGETLETPISSPTRREDSTTFSSLRPDCIGYLETYQNNNGALSPSTSIDQLVEIPWGFGHNVNFEDDYTFDIGEFLPPLPVVSEQSPSETLDALGVHGKTINSMKLGESVLLMIFLENGSYLHFPFFTSAYDRGWLMWTLTQSTSLYLITLALASLDPSKTEPGRYEDVATRYLIAVEELRTSLTVSNLVRHDQSSIKELCSMMGMLLLVKFNLLRGNPEWRIHLGAIISMVPTFFSTRDQLKKMPAVLSLTDMQKENDQSQLSNIIGYAMWYDIFSNFFAGTKQVNLERYLATLGSELSEIQFSRIVGCQNWVVVCLLKVSELQHRKRDMQRRSTWELMEEAMSIRQTLDIGIMSASHSLSRHAQDQISTDGSVSCFLNNEHDIHLVTYIYACAIAITLEVIISGPDTDSPVIQKHVASMMRVLTAISNTRILSSLSWPLCISGCMADSSKRQAFGHIISTFRSSQPYGTSHVFEVINECWRLRDLEMNKGDVDWTDAMKSLGREMIFI